MSPASKLSESDFQKWFMELAKLFGWRCLHVRKSLGRRGGATAWQTTTNIAGWVDCLLWRERDQRVLAAELKSEKGVVSVEQVEILRSLNAAGVHAYLWRPSDRDEIERVLR